MPKRTHYILIFAVGIITFFSFVFSTSSCKKNKDCKATITVVDSTGKSVIGAKVTMAPPQASPQGNLAIQTQTGVTDGSGSASFTFTLPAILQASVVPPIPPYSSGPFTGLVQLEEGQTATKTIQVH